MIGTGLLIYAVVAVFASMILSNKTGGGMGFFDVFKFFILFLPAVGFLVLIVYFSLKSVGVV